MGSGFRPTRLDPASGKRVKYRCHRIVWTDEHGDRKSKMAYPDRAASLALLRRMEQEVARRKEGLVTVDPAHKAKTAEELIEAYCAELVSRGSEPGGCHVQNTRYRLWLVFNGCGWQRLGDVRGDQCAAFMAQLAAAGRAASTRGLYLATARSLLRWCVEQKWLS